MSDRSHLSDVQPATASAHASAEKPTLYVCHGDDGGPRIHPCRRVQEALRAAGIEYEKVIAAHGSPIPFLRKGSRDELRAATGAEKLPALKLADGTVITHSRDILSWIDGQRQRDRASADSKSREHSEP
jgi:glutathione S-transferase